MQLRRLLFPMAFFSLLAAASAAPLKVGDPAPAVTGITETGTPLAFADVFRLMAWGFLLALVIVPFCKPTPQDGPAQSEH